MAASDSDEEESYVIIGTAFDVPDEDEPRRKKIHVEDLPAKDSRGRTRFHGAFTGGFSAGYFNTAGSKEGWTPSTFTSSRSQRAEKSQHGPEAFMDEEDLGEHGIAPRGFTTTESFAQQKPIGKRGLTQFDSISADSVLADLIVPDVPSMGVRLLRKMGWRDGQGVGPRRKKKHKQKEPEVKVYGCAMPPAGSDSEVSEGEAEYVSGFTFAPKDVTPVDFTPKDNFHGIGYSGIDPRAALQSGHFNLFETSAPVSRSGKRGIKGQAFGVGALEDDDDDVYSVDHMSNYHQSLAEPGDERDSTFGWTAPTGRQLNQPSQSVTSVTNSLQGFSLSSCKLAPSKVFPPPRIPPNFRPYHLELEAGVTAMATAPERGSLNFVTRGLLLGEKPSVSAISSLSKSSEKILPKGDNQDGKQAQSLATSLEVKPSESKMATTITIPTVKPFQINQTEESRGGSNAYKPFNQDPAKQQRYEQYMANLRHSKADPYANIPIGQMTEWEKEKEKEEFSRASSLYRPLSAMMASRFTTAKYNDADDVTMTTNQASEKSDADKAAEMKLFGQLTRETLEWHPDNTLCKRFNVPNPYPDSQIVGLPGSKRNRFSVFDFLDFTAGSSSHAAGGADKQQQQQKSEMPAIKSKEDSEVPAKVSNLKSGKKMTTANIFAAYFEEEDRKNEQKETMLPKMKPDATTEQVVINKDSQGKKKLEPSQPLQQKSDEERPPMDLFKAIFQDSDSESSSVDEGEKEREIAVKEDVQEVEGEVRGSVPEIPITVTSPAPPPDVRNSPIRTETLAERLSPEVEEEFYGPSLPPSFSAQPHSQGITSVQRLSENNHEYVEGTSTSHRKQKHKDRERSREKDHRGDKNREKSRDKSSHKHKKKKSKHKKTKHKKGKTEKRRRSSGYEASTSDSDSTSDLPLPSDTEILDRLKQISGKGRLKASDFM